MVSREIGKSGVLACSESKGRTKEERIHTMASKHGSLLAGAAGFIADVWTRVDKEARKRGATDEDIHAIVTERDKQTIEKLAEKFAEIIASARKAVGNIFKVTVD